MRNYFFRLFAALLVLTFVTGCKEKKEDKVIISSVPEEEVKNDTIRMDVKPNFVKEQWRGAEYGIETECIPDSKLGIATDDDGNKYSDNRIKLKITRSDGSVFLEKTYVKSDFTKMADEKLFKNKVLIAIVFNKIEGDNLVLVASVGSPDKFSDDYMAFDLVVTPSGSVSMRLSQQDLLDH